MTVEPQDEFEEIEEDRSETAPSEVTSSESSKVEPETEPAASTDDAFLDGWQLEDDSTETESDAWPADDLESAYRRALEANTSVEWDFDHLPADGGSENESSVAESDAEAGDVEGPADSASEPAESQPATEEVPERVSARQVIEAALFVGGEPIATKRLCFMLRGDYDLDFIEDTIEDLNHQYEREARPYEIRLGEGGYRLVLHDEFQRVRNRVFGIGPREVKLSQDVLEVLALVAYRQPVTQAEIEDLGRPAAAPLLRQLLRRELISIQRDEKNRKKVEYSTTRRFLSVFGLANIDELPQADELAFK